MLRIPRPSTEKPLLDEPHKHKHTQGRSVQADGVARTDSRKPVNLCILPCWSRMASVKPPATFEYTTSLTSASLATPSPRPPPAHASAVRSALVSGRARRRRCLLVGGAPALGLGRRRDYSETLGSPCVGVARGGMGVVKVVLWGWREHAPLPARSTDLPPPAFFHCTPSGCSFIDPWLCTRTRRAPVSPSRVHAARSVPLRPNRSAPWVVRIAGVGVRERGDGTTGTGRSAVSAHRARRGWSRWVTHTSHATVGPRPRGSQPCNATSEIRQAGLKPRCVQYVADVRSL